VTDARRAETFEGRTPEALALEWGVPRVELWARIGSTNDRAAELAVSGAPRGATVVAHEQTAGRGRRGNRWIAAAGAGLWMSVVLDAADAAPQLPLVVGVACAEGIEELAPALRVRLEWPNDLVIGRRKVGGVLAERASERVIVGIGINVSLPTDGSLDGEPRATALDVEGAEGLSRSALAGVILTALMRRLRTDRPVADAIEAIGERDALRNRTVETEQAGYGVARGVDEQGALVLERADGSRVTVVSGSVRLAEPRVGPEWTGARPAHRLD